MKRYLLLLLLIPFVVGGFRMSPRLSPTLGSSNTYGLSKTAADSLVLLLDMRNANSYGTTQDWYNIVSLVRGGFAQSNMEQATAGNQASISDYSRDFDGSDFMTLEERDNEQGNLTFVADGGTAEFRDDGQDFSDWETTPASTAAYRIVVTSDNGVSYGYLGASNGVGGIDVDIYDDIGLTSRGWLGRTTPNGSGDTAATYEIIKVIGTQNLTSDLWMVFAFKPDDGIPPASETIIGKDELVANLRGWYVQHTITTGKISAFFSEDGTNHESILTNNAILSDGAQSGYTVIGIVLDKTNATGAVYVNGTAVAVTETISTGTLYDSFSNVVIGNRGKSDQYYNGFIGLVIVGTGTVTAANMLEIYNAINLNSF